MKSFSYQKSQTTNIFMPRSRQNPIMKVINQRTKTISHFLLTSIMKLMFILMLIIASGQPNPTQHKKSLAIFNSSSNTLLLHEMMIGRSAAFHHGWNMNKKMLKHLLSVLRLRQVTSNNISYMRWSSVVGKMAIDFWNFSFDNFSFLHGVRKRWEKHPEAFESHTEGVGGAIL